MININNKYNNLPFIFLFPENFGESFFDTVK